MLEFMALAEACAPQVPAETMHRIVSVESSFNPHAIGVVGAKLEWQPRDRQEAIITARWLEENGYNYSVGLAQINKTNFAAYGLTLETAFEPCANLRAGAAILTECYQRASRTRAAPQALQAALSCYYSGNFVTGFRHGYVQKVLDAPGGPLQANSTPGTPTQKNKTRDR